MRHRLFFAFVLASVAIGCLPADLLAQNTRQYEWLLRIAHEDTIAIGRADLNAIKIDIARPLKALDGKSPSNPKLVQEVSNRAVMASLLLRRLKNAGASEILFTASVENLVTDSAIVIPCRDSQTVASTLSSTLLIADIAGIPAEYGYSVHQADGIVVFSTEKTLQRILKARDEPKKLDEVEEKRWNELLEPMTDQHWVAISVPIRFRSELMQLWPTSMSVGTKDISPRQLATDIAGMGFGLTLGQKIGAKARLCLLCVDDDAATRSADQLKEGISLLPTKINDFSVPEAVVTREGEDVIATWTLDDMLALLSAVVVLEPSADEK